MSPVPRRRHGALKADLTELLVHADHPLTAKELRALLPPPVPALASLLTVLERMRRSGEVMRVERPDDELRFAIAREAATKAVHGMLDSLLRSTDRTGALLAFAGSLDEADTAILREALGRSSQNRD